MATLAEMHEMSLVVVLVFSIFGHLTNAKEKSLAITLSEENWTEMLEGEWLVKLLVMIIIGPELTSGITLKVLVWAIKREFSTYVYSSFPHTCHIKGRTIRFRPTIRYQGRGVQIFYFFTFGFARLLFISMNKHRKR